MNRNFPSKFVSKNQPKKLDKESFTNGVSYSVQLVFGVLDDSQLFEEHAHDDDVIEQLPEQNFDFQVHLIGLVLVGQLVPVLDQRIEEPAFANQILVHPVLHLVTKKSCGRKPRMVFGQ